MKKIKCHFCEKFYPANGNSKVHIADQQPRNNYSVNRSECAPRDGFNNTPASLFHHFNVLLHLFILNDLVSRLFFLLLKKNPSAVCRRVKIQNIYFYLFKSFSSANKNITTHTHHTCHHTHFYIRRIFFHIVM